MDECAGGEAEIFNDKLYSDSIEVQIQNKRGKHGGNL